MHAGAQTDRVISINAAGFMQIADTSSRCVLMKLWVPNCPTANEQFKAYMDFAAGADMNIIYIGITSIPEKIITIAAAHGFRATLYMLDTAIAQDIYQRPDIFCREISQRLKLKPVLERFSTLMINRKKKAVKKDDIPGFPASLKQLCS